MSNTEFTTRFLLLLKDTFVLNRNTATQTVEQELLFVGQEAGKLLSVRDIVQKVSGFTVEGLHKDQLTDCTSTILCNMHFF